jgi:8-oxo-dGTP diphosphatase
MVEVAAGILVDGRSILACRRAPHGAHPLKWEFPGGKREAGESLAQCLARELLEELGVEVRVGAELWRTRHQYPGRDPVQLYFFRVDVVAGAPANIDGTFAEIRWVSVGELSRLDFLDADRVLVERIDGGAIALEAATRAE